MYQIKDLGPAQENTINEIAEFLVPCFEKFSPTWVPDLAAARMEIHKSFGKGRLSRVAVNGRDEAVGWIGAILDDQVWEIHPIAVASCAQRQGLGLQLVRDIERLAYKAGAIAVWAGTSDETGSTSLAGLDLYESPVVAMTDLSAAPGHPVNFWQKTGYRVVGVMPDEEGLGKPGIHFAKRIVTQ